jgi:hypothetical protein
LLDTPSTSSACAGSCSLGPTLAESRSIAIDIQNCFCEFDKYARVAHPEFNLKNEKGKEQNRIKQKFEESGDAERYWAIRP